METNKIGFQITIVSSIISFGFTFVPYQWVSSFSFAILGSSLISAFICLINYYNIRKNMINEVSRHFYILANTYRLLICNITTQKEIVINDFCNEVSAFLDCCKRCYDNSRGMFRVSKKEKLFCKVIIELSDKIVNLDSSNKNCVAFLYSDLNNGRNTNNSITYLVNQLKINLKSILKDIARIEDAFYSKKTLDNKTLVRERFKNEFGDLNPN